MREKNRSYRINKRFFLTFSPFFLIWQIDLKGRWLLSRPVGGRSHDHWSNRNRDEISDWDKVCLINSWADREEGDDREFQVQIQFFLIPFRGRADWRRIIGIYRLKDTFLPNDGRSSLPTSRRNRWREKNEKRKSIKEKRNKDLPRKGISERRKLKKYPSTRVAIGLKAFTDTHKDVICR